jgi:NADH-quinone oxidoreductase subunit A
MLENYFPVFVFCSDWYRFGIAPVITGMVVAPHRPDSEKLSPYECGFEAFEDARMKFDVRYYLIAILFILFDLEVAFLVPWATIFKEIRRTPIPGSSGSVSSDAGFHRHSGRSAMSYEWAKGALDWE